MIIFIFSTDLLFHIFLYENQSHETKISICFKQKYLYLPPGLPDSPGLLVVFVEVEDSDHVERQVGHHHHHHRGVEVHQPLQTLLLHGGGENCYR